MVKKDCGAFLKRAVVDPHRMGFGVTWRMITQQELCPLVHPCSEEGTELTKWRSGLKAGRTAAGQSRPPWVGVLGASTRAGGLGRSCRFLWPQVSEQARAGPVCLGRCAHGEGGPWLLLPRRLFLFHRPCCLPSLNFNCPLSVSVAQCWAHGQNSERLSE